MNNVTIRQATLQDVPAIERLHVSLMKYENKTFHFPANPRWPTTALHRRLMKQHLRSRRHLILVVEHQRRVIGFAEGELSTINGWRLPVRIGELLNIFVEPKYRSQGIGRQLITAVHAWAKKNGAERMKLKVVFRNYRAIQLYQAKGFKGFSLSMERDV